MIKKFIQKILGQPQSSRGAVDFGKRVEIPPAVHGINPALVDERALNVVRTLQDAGYEACVVGGAEGMHRVLRRGPSGGDLAQQPAASANGRLWQRADRDRR